MIDQVLPSALAAWFAAQSDDPQGTALPVLLDVREPWEWAQASVRPAGFELLTISMNQVPEQLAQLSADRPIACLCHHGMRSQRVAQFLVQQGFERVANVTGGIEMWSSEHDTSVPRY